MFPNTNISYNIYFLGSRPLGRYLQHQSGVNNERETTRGTTIAAHCTVHNAYAT